MFSVTPFSTAGFSAAGEAVANLSATLGSLTPAAATKVRVSANATNSLGGLSVSASAKVLVAGSCSVTLAGLGRSVAGKVAVSCIASVTLAGISAAPDADVAVAGGGAVTLSALGISAAGKARVSATAGAMLGELVALSAGAVKVAASSLPTLVDSFQSGRDLDQLSSDSAATVLVAGVLESGVTGQPLTIDPAPFSGAPFSSLDETYVTPLLEQLLCHSEADVLVLADLNATLVDAFQSGRDLDGLQLQADGLVRWLYDLDRELDAATSESELVLGGIGDQPATGLVVTPSDLGESAGGEDFSHTLTVQYIDPSTLSPQVINALSITPPTDWRFDIETSGLGSATIRVVISGRTPDIFSGQWTYIVDESVMEGGHPKLTVSPYNLIPPRIFALVRYEAGKDTKTPLDFVFSANGGTATVTKWVLNDLNAGKKLIPVVNCRSERRAPGTEESCRVLLAEAA